MKKSEKTEITKEKILTCAIAEFGTFGFSGATINQICQKNNISKGLIYHNFLDKDELYLRCVQRATQAFIEHMSKFDFGLDFKKYMYERNNFFEENPYYRRLIFSFILTENTELTEKLSEEKQRFDDFNKKIYMTALDGLKLNDGISKDDAFQYYSLLQNMLNNYFSIDGKSEQYFNLSIKNHEQFLEKILDFMLYGIAEKQ